MIWYFLDENLARSKTAILSDSYYPNEFKAAFAVDCDLTTMATSTNNYNEGDYWWKVDIGKRIIFTYATIYVRDGICGPQGSTPFNCCKCYCMCVLYIMYWTCTVN